jgi:glycosyltransferase involved in cell wall biosynthesis
MNIGLVIYGDLEALSGGFLYDRMLVDGLRADGHQVRVFSFPWRNYLGNLTDNLSHRLYARLASARLDVLIQDELNHASLFYLNRRLRREITYPIVSLVHHLRSSEPRPPLAQAIYRWIERRYLRSVDGFICNSHTTRLSVTELASKENDYVVAYPGREHIHPDVSPAEIRQRAVSIAPMRILFVGNLIRRKGLHVLIRSLEELDETAWRLDILGDTTMDPSYIHVVRSAISRSRRREWIHLHGAQPRDALDAFFRECHVMALPSFYEGFGIAYLEAMGFGLPVIASTAGGPRELITHGKTGFLIPPGDHHALSRYLNLLASDRGHLSAMGQAAQARYKAHPTWAEGASRVADFLRNEIGTDYFDNSSPLR